MKEHPLISIILPVYNGEAFLNEVVQSILDQTYKDFELIIVNDCSTDRSLIIANSYACLDKRIKIISNKENKKLPTSLNIGHKEAQGDFVTWTSDDNLVKVNFLESLYHAIIREKCDLVFSNFDIILSDGSIKREHVAGPVQKMLFENVIGASFLYKKKIFFELGGYNSNLFLVEDYDFFLRASLKFEFYHLNENLYQYRIHEKSLTSNIQSKSDHNTNHAEAISLMFNNFGSYMEMNVLSINFLIGLYFNDLTSLRQYLNYKTIIKQDLIKYRNLLKIEEIKECVIEQLREKIRTNWVLNKNELNFINLFRVLFGDRKLLIGSTIKMGRTTFIIYKCLFQT
tara:strand:+ start:14672 stop:15697 length:1026 start_codon:yes stop_codon:yes gene_type:complete